jgi:hypothetical protein
MKRQKRPIHDYLEDILRYTEKAQRFVADWARAVSKVGYVCSTPPSTTQDTSKRQFAHRRRRARSTAGITVAAQLARRVSAVSP